MKKILWSVTALSVAGIMASCDTQVQQSADNGPLTLSTDSLELVIAQKDSIINDAFNSIGEIALNINQIAEKERIVTQQTSNGGELTKPVREQIAENIEEIGKLLDRNQATIARLQRTAGQLKAANVKVDALQTLIGQLQEQINQKNTQLAELTEQVRALQIEVEALGHTVSNLENDKAQLNEEVAAKDVQLHAVYYILGSDKELMEKEVIDKKGGIGRTRVVSDDVEMTDFTKADDRTVERIPIGEARVRLVTSHPQNSYLLIKSERGDVVEELVITDKEAFWRNSRLLIIAHK